MMKPILLLLSFSMPLAAKTASEKVEPLIAPSYLKKYSVDWKKPLVKPVKTTSIMTLRDASGNTEIIKSAGATSVKDVFKKKETPSLGEKEFTSIYTIDNGNYKLSSSWNVTKNRLKPGKGPAGKFSVTLEW